MVWTWDGGPSVVVRGDSTKFISQMPGKVVQLVYMDPPFNTGKVQRRETVTTKRSDTGDRVGFSGNSYQTILDSVLAYPDVHVNYWSMLHPCLVEAYRVLKDEGTLYLHLNYREVHYAKVILDGLFGRECFLNEIIWAYDYGGKPKNKWPQKHNTILVYVKDPDKYFFDNESVDREPYMAPGLVTKEKAERGKMPTDVWWHTIVSPTGREKTGYPNQKPEGILRRIIQASSAEGDIVLDPFAGSGTTGAVAHKLGRKFIMVDKNEEAVDIMMQRIPNEGQEWIKHG